LTTGVQREAQARRRQNRRQGRTAKNHAKALNGQALRGEAFRCKAPYHGEAQHREAQHREAQHCQAQHGEAERRQAPHYVTQAQHREARNGQAPQHRETEFRHSATQEPLDGHRGKEAARRQNWHEAGAERGIRGTARERGSAITGAPDKTTSSAQKGKALDAPPQPASPKVEGEPGSAIYAEYFAQQLEREDERKSSLEARGVLVVTTSGVLSTILLGLATLTKKQGAAFALPHSARWWVIAALVLLALAVAGALVSNFPFKSGEADVDGLRNLVDESWDDSPGEAEKAVAINRLSVLGSSKKTNSRRAWFLFAAMVCELFALIAIAVAVGISL
jgi:hypothetical protein